MVEPTPPTPPALTAAQRDELAQRLRARRAALLDELGEQQGDRTRVEHARDVLEQDGHDARERDADREVDLARVDMESAELAAIGAALTRLERPDFGLCKDCGQPIPFARLKLEPQAVRCVACTERHEGRPASRL